MKIKVAWLAIGISSSTAILTSTLWLRTSTAPSRPESAIQTTAKDAVQEQASAPAGMRPVVETKTKVIDYTVMIPVYENHQKEVSYTVIKPVYETKEKTVTYTICTMVPETKTKTVNYTTCRMVPQAKQKTVEYAEVRYVPVAEPELKSK